MRIQRPLLARDPRHYRPRPLALPRRPCWVLQRKVLLTLAVAILVACAISSPLSFAFLLAGDTLVVLVVVGFVVAAFVRVLALVCLGAKFNRWHTRGIAPVFVLVALIVINALLRMADPIASKILGSRPFLSSAAAVYVLVALELVWLAFLR